MQTIYSHDKWVICAKTMFERLRTDVIKLQNSLVILFPSLIRSPTSSILYDATKVVVVELLFVASYNQLNY